VRESRIAYRLEETIRGNHLIFSTVPIVVKEHMKMKKPPSVADAEGGQALFGYLYGF
jgi:hypothetical protein